MNEILAYQMQHTHLDTAPLLSSWSSCETDLDSASFDSSSFDSLLSSSSMSSSYSSSASLSIVDSPKMSNCLQYRYPPQVTESPLLSRSQCSNDLSSLGSNNCNTSLSISSVGIPRRSSPVALSHSSNESWGYSDAPSSSRR